MWRYALFSCPFPEVELLADRTMSWKLVERDLFFTAIVLVYTIRSDVSGFPFPHILDSTCLASIVVGPADVK